jgi:hypothetical protein
MIGIGHEAVLDACSIIYLIESQQELGRRT